jgi:DNA polymerase kappa
VLSAEEEFEAAALQERIDEMADLQQLSQEMEASGPGGEGAPAQTDGGSSNNSKRAKWPCPVCSLPQPADNALFNQHVDFCLSKDTIKEVVKGTLDDSGTLSASSAKRKVPPDTTRALDARKRPFFG